MKAEQLVISDDIAHGIESAPIENFDDITPQRKHAMDIAGAYYTEKTEQYGEWERWPLEVKAEFSALSIQLGRGQVFDFGIDIVPAADDLPQEEALAIAKQFLAEQFSIPTDELNRLQVDIWFYDSNHKRTGHYWYFCFWNGAESFYVHVSSSAGEVVWMD